MSVSISLLVKLSPRLVVHRECVIGLLLNPTKTEAVIFGSSRRLGQVSSSPGVMAAGAHVKFSDAVKLLGVTFDSALTLDKHITNITRCCYYHIVLRALRHIRAHY